MLDFKYICLHVSIVLATKTVMFPEAIASENGKTQ
jgi:hypothetical protein